MLTHYQASSEAKTLSRLLLESGSVLNVGIFGSLTLGKLECPTVGDIDLLVMVGSEVEVPDPPIYYPDEKAILGIRMLAKLSNPAKLDIFDQAIALITSWRTRVDVVVIPECPTDEFLEWFYWRTTWGLLRHIAVATKIFDSTKNEFTPNKFEWGGYAASIRHMRDFAFEDGWGEKLENWEY